ncbi:hypothetical protein GCM10009630_31280 [Kribbella jejuensis]
MAARPLSRPALPSNKKNITDIHGADANRGPGPLSEAPGTRPRRRGPVPREAVLVPLVTSLTGVSASDSSIMPYPHKSFSCGRSDDRWEPVSRLPPVTHRTVQQTPLGEWPLEAA